MKITKLNIKFDVVTKPDALLNLDGACGKIAKTIKINAIIAQKAAYFSRSTDRLSNSTTKTIKISEKKMKKV